MWLIIYFLIGWIIYSFLREIIFNRAEGIPVLIYLLENRITPEDLDFKLFIISLFWPVLIIYYLIYGGRK
jgi:hypothetical protein